MGVAEGICVGDFVGVLVVGNIGATTGVDVASIDGAVIGDAIGTLVALGGGGFSVGIGISVATIFGIGVATATGVNGANVIGEIVGNEEIGKTGIMGTAAGRAIGPRDGVTTGCIAIGADLNGGFETGVIGGLMSGATGRAIGVVPVGGVSVIGDTVSIGVGSGTAILTAGGILGTTLLETGDAEDL